jgi:tripartite-type tricarboxylate transporter receptor subunit TctC
MSIHPAARRERGLLSVGGREGLPYDPGSRRSIAATTIDREDAMRVIVRVMGALGCVLAGAVLALSAAPAGAQAPSQPSSQSWPTHNILAISPIGAGNAVDIVGRLILDQMSRQLGVPIVIENRPGGGGLIGFNDVAKAQPDGYTLLLGSSTISSGAVLHKKLPYDPLKDFVAVVPFGVSPSVLVAAPSKGFNSVADLVAAAKAKPGALNYASAGIGAASHIAAERFRVAAGIDAQHVPFRGPNEALAEVVAGRVDYYFLPLAAGISLVQGGKLKALAVSTPKRSPLMPDVPTIAEAGYPTAQYLFWAGLFAPASTPPEIVTRLADEGRKALELPAVQSALTKVGYEPLRLTPGDFQAFFVKDFNQTIALAKQVGITPGD